MSVHRRPAHLPGMTAALSPDLHVPLYEQPSIPAGPAALAARRLVIEGATHLEVRHRIGTYLHQHRAPFRAVLATQITSGATSGNTYREATVLGLRIVGDVVYLHLADDLVRFDAVTALGV